MSLLNVIESTCITYPWAIWIRTNDIWGLGNNMVLIIKYRVNKRQELTNSFPYDILFKPSPPLAIDAGMREEMWQTCWWIMDGKWRIHGYPPLVIPSSHCQALTSSCMSPNYVILMMNGSSEVLSWGMQDAWTPHAYWCDDCAMTLAQDAQMKT